jgi:hypothetical protein
MKEKVNCTCGWSWNKSDSSAKDMYICHECGRDNSNNMKNGGWLDNYNDSQASAPEGMVGDGYSNVGRDYSPAWGGQFQEGGEIPMAQNGKKVKYVESENDPRYKAYQDSLSAYNMGNKKVKEYNEAVKKGKEKGTPLKVIPRRGSFTPYPGTNILPIAAGAASPTGTQYGSEDSDLELWASYAKWKKPQQQVVVKDNNAPQYKTVHTGEGEGRFEPIQRQPVKGIQNNLQPAGLVQNDFNIEAPLPQIRQQVEQPEYYDVTSQRQTMSGPSDYYNYNKQKMNVDDAVRAAESAEVYNKYIEDKYGNEEALKNPKAQERLKQLRQDIQVVPQAQNGKLTFLQPTSDKLPEGYRIPFSDPSTERAGSIGGENGEPAYLIPEFKYGRPIYDSIEEFKRTGEHLGGPFKTWQEADEWENTVRHPAVEKGETIMFPQEQFQTGGSLPGFTYARTKDIPSEGPYAKKTMPSAQEGRKLNPFTYAQPDHYAGINPFFTKDPESNIFIGGVSPSYSTDDFSIGASMVGVGNEDFIEPIVDYGIRGSYNPTDSLSINASLSKNNIGAGVSYRFKNGGWLDGYDKAQPGITLPSVRDLINDTMNRKIQAYKGKGKETNVTKKDNVKTVKPKIGKIATAKEKEQRAIEQNKLAYEESQKEAAKDWVQNSMQEAYQHPLMSPGYFTPEGAAIGALQAGIHSGVDLYEGDYKGAAINAGLAALPFVPKITKIAGRALGTEEGLLSKPKQNYTLPEIESELNLDINQRGFSLERTVPKVKKKLLPQWTETQLDNGLIEKTPLRKGINDNVVKQVDVPGKGEISLKTSTDTSGNPVYYFSANVPEGGLSAGKAFKHLEQFIPKGSKIIEQNSLSTDSFYNMMQRAKNPKKFTWVNEEQFVPLNSAGKNKVFSNNDKIVPGATNIKFEDYNEAKKALDEFNSRITIEGMPKAKLSKIVDDFQPVEEGPFIKKTTFGIDVPNIGLIKEYKQGGIIKGDQDGYRNPKNRGKVVEIEGDTMGTDGYDDTLYVVPDVGEPRIVYANTGNHEFPGATKFREYPMAQNGLRQEQKGLVNLDQLTNFTNYNKPQPGGWLNKYN